METNSRQLFDEAIKAKIEEYRSKFFEAVQAGIDKEFTWIDWLSNFKLNVGEEFQNLWDLLKEARFKYLRSNDLSEVLKVLAKEISIELSKQAVKTKLDYVKNNLEFHDFYSLDEMVEMGLNKELAEFLKSPNFSISALNSIENQSNGKLFKIDTHFLRERTVFNSYVELQESFKYQYDFLVLEFVSPLNFSTINDFKDFISKYVKIIPIAQNEHSSPFPIPINSALQNFNVPVDLIQAEELLINFLAYQDFISEYPNEHENKNGKSFLIGKSKKLFDDLFPKIAKPKPLRAKWQGSKSELAVLLFSLHKAGHFGECTIEDVLHTFRDLMPDEEKLVTSARANFKKFVNPKDNNAKKRFNEFFDTIPKAFEELYQIHHKD